MTNKRGKTPSPFIRGMARFGYAAKGLVYLIIGGLAARAAIAGGKPTDEKGALLTVLHQPFGRVLLGLVAAGLFAYALWRLIEVISDPEAQDSNGTRGFARFQYLLSFLVYTGLGIEAIRMILGQRDSGGGEAEAKEQAALLLSLPFGHWLLIVIGVAAIGFGLFELKEAFAPEFEDRRHLGELSRKMKPWILRLGRLGTFARGGVGVVVGAFLLMAGLYRSSSEAKGTRGAIESLAERPFGRWILALIAVGLIAHGLYTVLESRYRKLH